MLVGRMAAVGLGGMLVSQMAGVGSAVCLSVTQLNSVSSQCARGKSSLA